MAVGVSLGETENVADTVADAVAETVSLEEGVAVADTEGDSVTETDVDTVMVEVNVELSEADGDPVKVEVLLCVAVLETVGEIEALMVLEAEGVTVGVTDTLALRVGDNVVEEESVLDTVTVAVSVAVQVVVGVLLRDVVVDRVTDALGLALTVIEAVEDPVLVTVAEKLSSTTGGVAAFTPIKPVPI